MIGKDDITAFYFIRHGPIVKKDGHLPPYDAPLIDQEFKFVIRSFIRSFESIIPKFKITKFDRHLSSKFEENKNEINDEINRAQ